ncbi:MAG: LemA family protein [Ruminococcaceae bacterium]|nr:LemA family protein [Oscillospiraceae bacterium]
MAKKKRTALWVTLGILGFVIALLLGCLIFVEASIKNLDSSLDEKQGQVVAAFESRSEALKDLSNAVKSKMDLDPQVFTELENAEKQLKAAADVKAMSDANLRVDTAVDNLFFVLRDKYYYLEGPELWKIEEDIDSARSRIVIESTDYNKVAKDYNYAISNFPGDFLSNIFEHNKTEVFQIVEYKDIRL